MAKLRIKKKKGQAKATEKLSRSERLDQAEVALFSSRLLRGFFGPSVVGPKKISYLGPVGSSLSRFLRREIDKNVFFLIIAQILEAVKKIEHYGLHLRNLVLDKKLIFVNQLSGELCFIYQPIESDKTSTNVSKFIEEIVRSAVFKPKEDAYEASIFLAFLNQTNYFSTDEIAAYIIGVCPSAYDQFPSGLSGPIKSRKLSRTEAGVLGGRTVTGYEETTLLYSEQKTELLGGTNQKPALPVLIRTRTGEEVAVNKPAFRIGKERDYVDYCVGDNRAVSRSHADIITRDGRYFILDRGSTNRTLVNDVVLEAQKETEIFNGDRLKLADEKFDFKLIGQ